MASDPSADLSSPSVGSPYDSLRIRIPKSESPPGLDLQTDASSAHDFILQFTFQKIKSSKNKNSIHGVNCTLQIIHIVLLYGTEDLHLTRKYDTIAHFFHKVLFDFLRPRFSIFWGKIHALMEGNSRIRPSRSPDTAAACKNKSGENIFGVSIKSSGFARRSFDSLLFISGEDYFT